MTLFSFYFTYVSPDTFSDFIELFHCLLAAFDLMPTSFRQQLIFYFEAASSPQLVASSRDTLFATILCA